MYKRQVPITQIEVGPQSTPWGNKNVGVVGTVPTCTLAVDTIHITATSVITPSFQAIATSLVNVVPDPEICPVADVGIAKVVSSRVITAGQSVTFTLTISNHEQTAVDAVVTDFPYGKASTTKKEPVESLYNRAFFAISNVLKQRCKLVCAIPSTESIKIGSEYLDLIEVHPFRVHKSLIRYICVFMKC